MIPIRPLVATCFKQIVRLVGGTLVTASMAMATGAPIMASLTGIPSSEVMTVENGSVEDVEIKGQRVWRWHVNAGQTSTLAIRRDHPLFNQLRYYDHLQFDYRIASGEISSISLNTVGLVSGIRQYKLHNFRIAIITTPKTEWHAMDINMAMPYWFVWDNPDGEGDEGYFHLDAMALATDTVIEIRDARFLRGLLYVKPDFEMPITWPVKTVLDDGAVSYAMTFQVLNTSGRPADITAAVRSTHPRFAVAIDNGRVSAKSGAVATFTLTATISAADISSTPELYSEPLDIEFGLADRPEVTSRWSGPLVRPLTPGYRTQVILPETDIAFLRKQVAADDAGLKRLIGYDETTGKAGAFAAKRLLAIPRGYSHVSNSYPANWRPGEMMPEAVDTVTGERRFGDHLAGQVWREYLGFSGQAPFEAGLAYALTGDERFATNIVALLDLYGQQYAENAWRAVFDTPFMRGSPLQTSSRQASNSSYGSNWDFKWILEGLSLISGSTAWKNADRDRIYRGFVLPYATELAKLPAQISNQTDISNHNLLLLGLVFDDAHLVFLALRRDCGLLPRLQDIDTDGFSAEGRPLNYHWAAAAEYLPSVTHLINSGLNVQAEVKRILAALRMPYRRATLSGFVPNSGDCGRGQSVRNTPLADIMIGVAPGETWLADIGTDSTIPSKLRRLRAGDERVRDGWRRHLETAPTLFSEAGLAVLRDGVTAQDQIMATLDYGRSVFHGARDRNQITLWAFGSVFTHGPGSLYNAGRGGITVNPDPRAKSFISGAVSLTHNVVVVDEESQLPAIGKLLAWSDDPGRQVAVSRVEGIAPGVAHTRGLVLTHGVVVVLDRIESQASHTFDIVYHNFGTLSLESGWQQSDIAEPLGVTGNYDNLIGLKRATGKGALGATWDLSGQRKPSKEEPEPLPLSLRFWQQSPEVCEVFTAMGGLNNPNTGVIADAAPMIIRRVIGSAATCATVLEPIKSATSRIKDITLVDRDGVTISFQDGRAVTVSLEALIRECPVPKVE